VNKKVLDASAVLALLNEETGSDVVKSLFPDVAISAVNLAEVVGRLSAVGMPEAEIREAICMLGLETVSFDEEQAFRTGMLYQQTRESGLSLGDRACMALAQTMNAPAVTADRAWRKLKAGVKVELIR
jgi:PIN domain nuclease of toxin-antitoxin system